MNLSPKVKALLIISAKQAVGAVMGNSALWALMPTTFNFHDTAGWSHFGLATLSFIWAAEGKVWIPKLYTWINSPTPGA
jgi:hypothetical protein